MAAGRTKKRTLTVMQQMYYKREHLLHASEGFFFAANYKLCTTGYFTGASMGS